ncbi:hypothetical protein AAZX31_09G156000 [Glycine max]|uniref:mitogen-activated protein kinase kinase n=2 Tax=Glycine soja TaxID=3848 RepID=A0A445J2A1_GLYSO|nr:mitogen-activated protein kinase kinase 9-like [Glycine soja]KAG5007504.1 hypothetical protein JHK85_026046 [Glycine max]KAG5013277.1 hypothetical protein JHK86_025538 [Glycine max]KAH1234077.1 Mitogen-activated protein kinase kinase 7 [Glycine max]RZB92467.1 Mitogen-activated protein kinase kinase 7 [Glycine soja]
MALIRRRHPNLRLPILEPTERKPHFSLPLVPPTTKPTTNDDITIDDLEKLVVLGHGNGGTIYKVYHKTTSTTCALKIIHGGTDVTTHRRALVEASILRRATNCPHVVNFYSSFEMPTGDVAILMEYMDGGSLETALAVNGTFSEERLVTVARDVLDGLAYLHAQNIVHLDIKPANILINTQGEVKITDFGVSKVMSHTLEMCNSYVGTCAYMSPERFNSDAYGGEYNGFAADVWSLGLTLLELYVGYFPLLQEGQRPNWATLMCAICFDEPPSLPETASPEFRNFVECCLKKESSERWTTNQLLNHPFVCKNPKTY